jgi:two-component system sensor histidine kinase PilS (NtrC family)
MPSPSAETQPQAPYGYFPSLRRRSPARWTSLRLFALYRLVLATGFFVVSLVDPANLLLMSQPRLFRWLSLVYAAVSVVWAVASWIERRGFHSQVYAQVLGDIIFITLLMHAAGGIGAGIGMLMIVSIAASSLLIEGRIAILFAAVGSVAVLGEYVFGELYQITPARDATQAGLLGLTLFATALLSHLLARRARESEALATQRGIDVANLSRLNEQIIQRMQSGVLVLDGEDRVRMLNDAARRMLDARGRAPAALANLSPILQIALNDWRSGEHTSVPLPAISTAGDVQVRFRLLGPDESSGTVIYLEDVSAVTDRLQQRKLASLGHLTASIAHEIRNPLGAISHAAQLLEESPSLREDDRAMTAIITRHSARVNEIVESILQLSRGEPTEARSLELVPWLERFISDFTATEQVDPGRFVLESKAPGMAVTVDPRHLQQILTNLCTNALAHGSEQGRVILRSGRLLDSTAPYLEVCDDGPGVPAEVADQVFEPFFTTRASGTGLGLFIASELCEMNSARLQLVRGNPQGACFRLTFSSHLTQVER